MADHQPAEQPAEPPLRVKRTDRVPLTPGVAIFTVHEGDRAIGTLVEYGRGQTSRRYRILDAGAGVEVPEPTTLYLTPMIAAQAVVNARRRSAALAARDDGLTGFERAVLDIEVAHGATMTRGKSDAIHALHISPTRYLQALNRLLDEPAAEVAEPMLIHRLRRLREERRAARRFRAR